MIGIYKEIHWKAIQREELDTHIGLDDLLMSIQLRENWLNNLK